MKTRELPEKINPGDELEVQLAPIGDWPNVTEKDGKQVEVVQRVTPEAVSRLVANFAGEVLVDVDHESIGGGTEAAAWVTGLRADPEKGLVGTFRFTDKGAEAVNSREYRFLSVAWFCDKDGHPFELDSVALTNRPNLPVRPILNRQSVRNNMFTDGDMASTAGGGSAEQPKDKHMDKLKALLGLDAGADEAAIEAAVEKTRIANGLADAEAAAAGGPEGQAGASGADAGEARAAADRLARIGGFVGGSAPMRKTEDLLARGNKQRGGKALGVKTWMAYNLCSWSKRWWHKIFILAATAITVWSLAGCSGCSSPPDWTLDDTPPIAWTNAPCSLAE